MHINSNHADQIALACALAPMHPCTLGAADSPTRHARLMPLIGTGTFLVAAYLRSGLGTYQPADNDRVDRQP